MIVIGELNTAQLPGQTWTVIPTTRIWSWGGLEELTAKSPSMAIACRPQSIEWSQVVALIQAAPFERGFIGDLKVFRGQIWWKGWMSLDTASGIPDVVLSVVRRILAGAETLSAELAAQHPA